MSIKVKMFEMYCECGSYSDVANAFGYAISTTRSYVSQGRTESHKNELAEQRKKKIEIRKTELAKCENVKTTTTKGCTVEIQFANGFGIDTPEGEKCYLFKFLDKSDDVIFSKIGTTKNKCEARLRREISDYRNKNGFDIRKVIVCKIIDCGAMPAESYESYLRAVLIKKYPNTWHRNDRFFGVEINTDEFVKVCNIFEMM